MTAIAYSTTCEVASVARDGLATGATPLTPALLLGKLNKALHKALDGRLGMTFFATIIDTASGTMHYANAGHNFPLLMAAKGGDQHGKRQITSLNKTNGMPLGFDSASPYKDGFLHER